jgi:hypothetical protein
MYAHIHSSHIYTCTFAFSYPEVFWPDRRKYGFVHRLQRKLIQGIIVNLEAASGVDLNMLPQAFFRFNLTGPNS